MELTTTPTTIPNGPRLTVAGIHFQLPALVEATLHDRHTIPDYEIEISVRYGFDAAPVVTAAGLRQRQDGGGRPIGPEVTTSALRKLPVPTIAGGLAPLVVQMLTDWQPDEATDPRLEGQFGLGTLRPATDEERAAFRQSYRSQRYSGSDDRHEAVAAVYRHAMSLGRPATQAVADAFGRPHGTAKRWVADARDAGALGPAPGQGVAGEVSDDEVES